MTSARLSARCKKLLLGAADNLARVARCRFVRESGTGLAYGETQLRRVLDFLHIDTVFDVGANLGQYASELRKNLGYTGKIISYEPLPDAAQRLESLAAGDDAWYVRRCAVDDREGSAEFHVMAGSQFSSLLTPEQSFDGRFDGKHRVEQTIRVEVTTLERVIGDNHDFKSALLKLDTQGTELRILRGGQHALQRLDAIQLEVGFQRLYQNEALFEEVLGQMREWGFEMCSLFPNNRGHFPHLLEMDSVFIRRELLPRLN